MVNAAITAAPGSERALAISYARPLVRPALAALLALDDTLAGIVRSGRDAMVAQLRLTWWHDALSALDAAPAPAQPVLEALAAYVLPAGVPGARIAGVIDGWEVLLDAEPMTAERLQGYAAGRGGALFAAAGAVLGARPADPLAAAGEGWALAALAANVRDPAEARAAAALARERFARAFAVRWSSAARALGALALSARMDLARPGARAGGPARVLRLLRHRLSGR